MFPKRLLNPLRPAWSSPSSLPSQEVDDALIQLDDIVLALEPRAEPFSFRLKNDEIWILTGPLGGGKSSLIKALLGFIRLRAGCISLFGHNISNMNYQHLQQLRLRVGVLFDDGGFIDSWTVYENLALPLRYHGKMREAEIQTEIDKCFDLYAFNHALLAVVAADLSPVQRRELSCLRILLMKPELLIVDGQMSDDELQYMLNSRFGRSLQLLIPSMLIVATPSAASVLAKGDCKLAIMMEGRIMATGRLDELLKHPNQQVRNWLFTELQAHAGDAH